MTELRELPAITEDKLRELEKLCGDPLNFTEAQVNMYYMAAKRLYDAGYDTRHHVASAYALIKKFNLNIGR